MALTVGSRVKLSAVGLMNQSTSYTTWEGVIVTIDPIGGWCEVEWDALPGHQYPYYETWLEPIEVTAVMYRKARSTSAPGVLVLPGDRRPTVRCAKCQVIGKVVVKEIYDGTATCICKLCGKEYQE